MWRYTEIDLIFLAISLGAFVWQRHRLPNYKAILLTLLCLLILTLIFDNIIIALGIVGYTSHILGIRLIKIPLEDFGYPIAGVLLISALWGTDND